MLESLNIAFGSDNIVLQANASHWAVPTCMSPLSLKRPDTSRYALIVLFLDMSRFLQAYERLKESCYEDEDCKLFVDVSESVTLAVHVPYVPCGCDGRCPAACRLPENRSNTELLPSDPSHHKALLNTLSHYSRALRTVYASPRASALTVLATYAGVHCTRRLIRAPTIHVP
jgi:hypothetical protein